MPTRTADAEWQGDLRQGKGTMRVGSGAFEGSYSFKSRMGDETVGTNPEELIGAAHAGCYSMALSNALASAGFTPTRVHTTARVHFNHPRDGFSPRAPNAERVLSSLRDLVCKQMRGRRASANLDILADLA